MHNPATFLDGYVLARAQDEPLRLRAKLYRALAAIASTPRRQRALDGLAADLEAIEARHEQLMFDFRTKQGAQR